MKFDYLAKRLGGCALAFFLLSGVVLFGAPTAQAQWSRDDRYGRDRYYNNGYQVARQRGYSYGLGAGSVDAQRNRRFDPQRSRIFRNGTEGYNRSFGNRGQYRQIFRDAFLQGYREGYQRYAYNRNDRYDRRNGRWVNGVWVPW